MINYKVNYLDSYKLNYKYLIIYAEQPNNHYLINLNKRRSSKLTKF